MLNCEIGGNGKLKSEDGVGWQVGKSMGVKVSVKQNRSPYNKQMFYLC